MVRWILVLRVRGEDKEGKEESKLAVNHHLPCRAVQKQTVYSRQKDEYTAGAIKRKIRMNFDG
jgi:hypothetical protein